MQTVNNLEFNEKISNGIKMNKTGKQNEYNKEN